MREILNRFNTQGKNVVLQVFEDNWDCLDIFELPLSNY